MMMIGLLDSAVISAPWIMEGPPPVSVPWWIWALVILAGIMVVGASLLIRPGRPTPPERAPETPPRPKQPEAQPQPAPAAATPVASVELEPVDETGELEPELPTAVFAPAAGLDDLKIIHGVSPSVVSVLNSAGIRTFEQLARTSVDQLEKIMRSAGIRNANPETWPAQAKLAHCGEWETLQTLQKQLKETH